MSWKSIIKGTGMAALSLGVLSGCGGEEASDEYLTDADVAGFYTEEELNAWAEEQGFYTGEELQTWAEEQGFLGEEAAVSEEVVDDREATAIDLVQVEEHYLLPLGWTEEEFNAYLMEEYGMGLADFASFQDLQETVGPVLTDETFASLLEEYSITEEEYNTYLEEAGLAPEDVQFVNEVEPILKEATVTEGE